MSGAAGSGGKVEVEDIERGVPDGDGDTMHLQELVLRVDDELCVRNGVVNKESQATPGVPEAVSAEEGVTGEGECWRVLVEFSFLESGYLHLVLVKEEF